MIYGYARVSTVSQDFQSQIDTLEKEGCEVIYKDKFTGTSKNRKEFSKLLEVLQDGDKLVVTKLDRLARNTKEGIEIIDNLLERGVKVHVLNVGYIDNTSMGKFFIQTLLAVAELERNMIVERTQEGKEVARKRPDYVEGRPNKYSNKQLEHANKLKENHSYKQVEELTGISKSTLIRYRRKLQGRPPRNIKK